MKRYEYSLLATCERLHMACNGSADPMSDVELLDWYQTLRTRLKEWEPAHASSQGYDAAVERLVGETIEELSSRLRQVGRVGEKA